MSLVARYKRYGTGGNTNTALGLGQGAALVGQMADALSPSDRYGKQSLAGNILSKAGSYTSIGAQFGPWGAAAGAGIGLVAGVLSNSAQNKQRKAMIEQEHNQQLLENQQRSAAVLAGDPTLLTGSRGASYFAKGGYLGATATVGGQAKPLSSTASDIQGPSHSQGGVRIPAANAEVEGGETTNGSYVYSKQLGFAQLHRPVAKAIGKIEKKALTPERVNSLHLLKEKEQQLKVSQEFVRKLFNQPDHE